MKKGFTRGKIDDLLIVQIYVDDIIFGSTNENMCSEFSKIMQKEFEMSMMGELNFFLGHQTKQTKNGIFINQSKYIKRSSEEIWYRKIKNLCNPNDFNNQT